MAIISVPLALLALPDLEVIPAWLYVAGPLFTILIGGLASVIVMHYRSVQNGNLVPRSTVELIQLAHRSEIERTNKNHADEMSAIRSDVKLWREAWEVERAANTEEAAGKLDELVEGQRVQLKIVETIQARSHQRSRREMTGTDDNAKG